MRKHLLPLLLGSFVAACGSDGGGATDAADSVADTDAGDVATAADTSATDASATDASATDASDSDASAPPDGWVCPAPSVYVGEAAWPAHLAASAEATYCSGSEESFVVWDRTGTDFTVDFAGQHALQAQLRVLAGDYRLPDQAGSYPFVLPLCVRLVAGEPPVLDGEGTLEVVLNTIGRDTYLDYTYRQPMVRGGDAFELELRVSGLRPPSFAEPLAHLDGDAFDVFGTNELAVSVLLCSGECSAFEGVRSFDSCHFDEFRTRRHRFEHTRGSLEVDLRYGNSFASTEPAAFVRAVGVLDGVAFDQDDFFGRVYVPEHHHFGRHFAVLFDVPIAGACGIRAQSVDEDPDGTFPGRPAELHLIDCDFAPLEALTITDEAFQAIEP